MKKKLYIVAGPTAVGKSEYAIRLAKEIDGEIVSLDSVQVYKYLNIGSAKITKEEMQGIRHYMIDEVEPTTNLNVKIFKDMANNYIREIYEKGKTPILVGGTGFYIRAVLYDTDFVDEDDVESERIRKELESRVAVEGIDNIYEELKMVDIDSANAIPKNNIRRVVRALEFFKMHNYPISEHNRKERLKESEYDYEFYVLFCDRDELYNRINKRVDIMFEKGLIYEVVELIEKGFTKDLNAMQSIGYKELYDYCYLYKDNIKNNIKNDEMKFEKEKIMELIKQHSRNYAKRQLTWFKSQNGIKWKNIFEK